MRTLILATILLAGSGALASTCNPTLQIQAKISTIKAVYPSTCIVSIDQDSVVESVTRSGEECVMNAMANGQSSTDPSLLLSVQEVVTKGISVGIIDDEPENCELKPGDTINGYLIRVPYGIYLAPTKNVN